MLHWSASLSSLEHRGAQERLDGFQAAEHQRQVLKAEHRCQARGDTSRLNMPRLHSHTSRLSRLSCTSKVTVEFVLGPVPQCANRRSRGGGGDGSPGTWLRHLCCAAVRLGGGAASTNVLSRTSAATRNSNGSQAAIATRECPTLTFAAVRAARHADRLNGTRFRFCWRHDWPHDLSPQAPVQSVSVQQCVVDLLPQTTIRGANIQS